jgi:superfamily II DNA or RNA helicase
MNYDQFLIQKQIVDSATGIEKPSGINPALFPFQRAIVEWGLKRGRAAFFEGTGLGKTGQQCEWARHVEAYTERPVIIVAPLAVSHQTIAEAKKILGMEIHFAATQGEIQERGVYVTNYQKLDRFDARAFGGIVLDESSILKSQDGSTK